MLVEQKWTKKGSCLLLAGNRNTLALPGSCVRLRPLPTYRKPRLVPPPPVALDVNEPLDIQLHLPSQIALDGVLLDLLADEGKLGIIQFENALVLDSLSASVQCTNNLFWGDGTVSVSGEHIAVTCSATDMDSILDISQGTVEHARTVAVSILFAEVGPIP